MKKEGVRRLSIFVGILGLLIWTGLVINGEYTRDLIGLGVIAGFPLSFLLPFWIVRGIDWVKDGFMTDRVRKNKNE